MEVYARVRRAVQVDGMSIREAAREFGLALRCFHRLTGNRVPPGATRTPLEKTNNKMALSSNL